MFKNFSIKEGMKVQFRTEMFNLFNTPQFDLPNTAIGNPAAGRITATIGNNRQVQMRVEPAAVQIFTRDHK